MKMQIVEVKTKEDLYNLRNLEDGKVIIILNNDIDLSNIKEFPSIDLPRCSVVIYGRGHKIKNLNIDEEDTVGLFSDVKDLYVRNLNIENANIKGICEAGILAGSVNGTLDIKSSTFSGTVTSEFLAGSIAGIAKNLRIKDTKVDVKVTTEDYTEGITSLTLDEKVKRLTNNTEYIINGNRLI